MKRSTIWTIVIQAVILLLIVPGILLLTGMWSYGGMMGGYGGFPGGMMGRGYSMMFPLGWLGMLMMVLIPIALLALIVIGAVWLINGVTRNDRPISTPPANVQLCPNCHTAVQSDWKNCPYCGTKLNGE